MHPNFADWYQPVTFKHDREVLELRWNGVESIVENLNYELVFELVKIFFEKQSNSSQAIIDFKQKFKEADPTFPLNGNDEEVKVLAGAVLAILCLNDHFEIEESIVTLTALSLLTASTCNCKKPLIDIDLIGMANKAIYENGIIDRKRSNGISPVNYSIEEGDTNTAIQEMINKLYTIQKTLMVQDEEIQILWWMIGGWSTFGKSAFRDIENNAQPLLLAKEIAMMTNLLTEPPSLQSIFSKVLSEDTKKMTIPTAVEACGTENLSKLKKGHSNQFYAEIFPLHFAIERAIEAEADGSWTSAWRKLTGIHQSKKFNSMELSMQLFREHKLIELSEAWDE